MGGKIWIGGVEFMERRVGVVGEGLCVGGGHLEVWGVIFYVYVRVVIFNRQGMVYFGFLAGWGGF